MFEKIPAPVKGQPARASWGAALTSRVNELCAMAPARGLARDGLTGTGFAALPSNRRERGKTLPPWSFICSVEKPATEGGEEKRTGGWRNCRLQIGYNGWLVSPDLNTPDMLAGVAVIEGTDRTDDGSYVVEVDVSKDTAKILLDLSNQILDVLFLGHIGKIAVGLDALCLVCLKSLFHMLLAAAVKGDLCAGCCQTFRDGKADAVCGAGDQSYFTFQ